MKRCNRNILVEVWNKEVI